MLRRAVSIGLAAALLGGFSFFDSLFAPKSELWPKWQAHDKTSTTTIDHSAWDKFLKVYVTTDGQGINRVAYRKAGGEAKDALMGYLEDLREVDVLGLNRREQMAYWINLYNALTVRLVLEFYPVKSIRDIDKPWDRKLIRISGEMLSLNDIEHRILRPIWQDARIHYVVNCAAISCPNLARDAYRASEIEQQLAAAARAYVNDPRGAVLDDGELTLSKIYSWYADDFGGESGVLNHLAEYSSSNTELKLMMAEGVDGYVYDWALNELK